ncbi:MAG: aminoacyl-tRNA hydrolase [Rhodospirillales bacterium]
MAGERVLLAGLGNPGSEYAGNRHNVGFMAVEAIARRERLSWSRSRFHGVTAAGALGGANAAVAHHLHERERPGGGGGGAVLPGTLRASSSS